MKYFLLIFLSFLTALNMIAGNEEEVVHEKIVSAPDVKCAEEMLEFAEDYIAQSNYLSKRFMNKERCFIISPTILERYTRNKLTSYIYSKKNKKQCDGLSVRWMKTIKEGYILDGIVDMDYDNIYHHKIVFEESKKREYIAERYRYRIQSRMYFVWIYDIELAQWVFDEIIFYYDGVIDSVR